MFSSLFSNKNDPEPIDPVAANQALTDTNVARSEHILSLAEQKERRQERRRAVIEEFGKPLVNIQLHDGLMTPIHVVDLLEVVLPLKGDIKKAILNGLNQSIVLHQKNLHQRLYRESFNFQPSRLLMLITDNQGQHIAAFRDYENRLDNIVKSLDPRHHRLLLVRYFVPSVPDDLRRHRDIFIPSEFERVLIEIINFCEVNFNLYNLPLPKWEALIGNLAASGLYLIFPPNNEDRSILNALTLNHGEINYKKVRVHQLCNDRVEKQTAIIPYFVLLLAFFCSQPTEAGSFEYHYLFSVTGNANQKVINQENISFQKLFNQLLDTSLLPAQFNKCLAILFNEAFKPHQEDIEDYLTRLQNRAPLGSSQSLSYAKPWDQDLANFNEDLFLNF